MSQFSSRKGYFLKRCHLALRAAARRRDRRQGLASAGPRGPGGDVQVELKVYVEDAGEFEDLRGWMTGQHPGVGVTAVPKPPEPYTQGPALWDYLSVACEPGGAGVAALGALAIWIRSRVSTVRVKIGENEFLVKSRDADEILPKMVEAVKALEETPGDERS